MLPTASPDLPAAVPGTRLDLDLFADSYASARARFAVLAKRAGAVRDSFAHPLPGPDGGALATDTAWLGPVDAPRVLVLQSALHGVEGFAGSALQCDLLARLGGNSDSKSGTGLPDGMALPDGVALLLIHAINPWGFAWLRRCNEDGVDLNRNFIDFTAPLPANPLYDQLAEALVPVAAPPAAGAADLQLAEARARLGSADFEAAITRGQYRHPQGLFYGGTGPAWSQRVLIELLNRHGLRERAQVLHIDLHTGLGPYGHGELICDHPPGSIGVATARRLFGPSVTEPFLGTSSSAVKDGLVDFFWHRELGARGCFVTLEFGTWPSAQMLPVLRADHVLHAAGPVVWTDAHTQQVKADLRTHFFPPRRDWRQLVLLRGRQVIEQAFEGLSLEGRSTP